MEESPVRLTFHKTAFKHGISEDDIEYAWNNFARKRLRGNDCWVCVGFDAQGRDIEIVGLILSNNDILIIHAMHPVTEKIRRELEIKR